jgi:hypothetical protein
MLMYASLLFRLKQPLLQSLWIQAQAAKPDLFEEMISTDQANPTSADIRVSIRVTFWMISTANCCYYGICACVFHFRHDFFRCELLANIGDLWMYHRPIWLWTYGLHMVLWNLRACVELLLSI